MNQYKMSSRILYFDILNICSCLAVIFLHHNGIVHDFSNTAAWRESLIVECGFYWAVPVFLMLSGANLLNYRSKYNTVTFFKKRFLRTAIPWFLWSIIMLLWQIHLGNIESYSPSYLFDLIFNYKVVPVYWFFGALFACYLAIPVFSLLCNHREILWYTVIINFIFCSCLPVLQPWFNISWNLDIPIKGSLMIYVLLGYLLSTKTLKPKYRRLLYICGIGSFLFRYVYTYVFSVKNGQTDVSIKGYSIFHAVFLSVAVFELAQNINWEKYLPQFLIKKLPFLSSCSFGIYLIHKIVMYYELSIFHLPQQGHIWRIVFVPCTYCISLFLIYLIKKIPFIGKYLC